MAYDSKKWYESKTVVINFLAFVAGFTLWAKGEIETGAPITLLSVANFLLRFITKKEIK